jgi:microcompartment protein CcmL/EutN
MSVATNIEALGLLEIDGLPRAIRCQDEALKRAPVEVIAFAPVSPGKVVFIMAGDVASVEESLATANEIAGSRRLDYLFLPGIHPKVVTALLGNRNPIEPNQSLGLLEFSTVAAGIQAADCAIKTADIQLGRLHLASGFGGKAYFTLWGSQSDVEVAVDAANEIAGEKALDSEVIASPQEDLNPNQFVRPWGIDPAG